MLAVVDPLACVAVDERRRPSTELTAGFEHDDALARLGERGRRRQTRNAAADHGDVELRSAGDVVMAIGRCGISGRESTCAARRAQRSARAPDAGRV